MTRWIKGSLKMDDTVTTSAHAKSMGGSQVFLEEGEIADGGDPDQVHCGRVGE